MPQQAWSDQIWRQGYAEYLRTQRTSDRALAQILRDAAEEGMRAVLGTVGDGIGAQVRRAQYNQAVLALNRMQRDLWSQVEGQLRMSLPRSVRAATQADLKVADVLARSALDQNDMLYRSFMFQAETTVETVRSRILNDVRLSDYVYKNRAVATGRVQREVNRGLSLGRSAREIAQSVRYLINPNTPGGVSYAAMRLGRTELNNAFHATTIRTTSDQPWTEGYRWNLSASHKREDECDTYSDRSPWSVSEVPQKPHPQCLCYLTVEVPTFETFRKNLFGGSYDDWLSGEGYARVGA